jgi:hypothetical protein
MRLPLLVMLLALVPACARRVPLPPRDTSQPQGERPPGQVELNFISEDERSPWELYVRDQLECSSPCTRWVNEWDGITLRSRSGRHELYIPGLAAEGPPSRRVLVVAENPSRAKQVNGIVFTTLGGMAVVTGITFAAVGCSNPERRGGLCTAGLITGGVGLPMTAGAILMLIDSMAQAEVIPLEGVSLRLTPTGLAGKF